MPNLYLIPCALETGTELQILTPQVADVLKSTKTFFVEDVRSARRFISACKLGVVIEELQFEVVDKKTKREKIQSLFKKYKGQDIGIISEAGCPGVADPGAVSVALAHEMNFKVIPLIGASSILLSLMASGLNGQRFEFHGYLPINREDRERSLKFIETKIARDGSANLFIETPFRNNQMLDSITTICAKNLDLTIAADITGANEFIQTKSVKDWSTKKPELHKRPVIFILGRKLV